MNGYAIFLDTFMPQCNRAGQGVIVSNCIKVSEIFYLAAMAKVSNLEGVIV